MDDYLTHKMERTAAWLQYNGLETIGVFAVLIGILGFIEYGIIGAIIGAILGAGLGGILIFLIPVLMSMAIILFYLAIVIFSVYLLLKIIF